MFEFKSFGLDVLGHLGIFQVINSASRHLPSPTLPESQNLLDSPAVLRKDQEPHSKGSPTAEVHLSILLQ